MKYPVRSVLEDGRRTDEATNVVSGRGEGVVAGTREFAL
jgi:hypothetical protein